MDALESAARLATAVTWLFVPGDRPERFDKAVAAKPDVVVLDLEDAVATADKPKARSAISAWLQRRTGGVPVAMVRINAIESPTHDDDLALILELGCPVMVPKVERCDQLERLSDLLGSEIGLAALIETPRGVLNSADLCAMRALTRPALGTIDLANALGVDPEQDHALLVASETLVLAAAAAEKTAVAGVHTRVRDPEGLRRRAESSAALGFGGMLCIHPDQVPIVAAAFSPTPAQVAWASRVVTEAETGAAALVDGQMVDRPVLERARSILRRAG
jgi:citrate lyase subunit beta/citryl-CoA lyase